VPNSTFSFMTTFRKKPLNKNFNQNNQKIIGKSVFKPSSKNKKFDYHLRLPFKMAQMEFKYLWTFLGFISISITLLLVLQNLTTYSSNNLAPQKPRTVRLITNFGQKTTQNQENIIQEFRSSEAENSQKNTTTDPEKVNTESEEKAD
jgi:hypothetical protein